MQRGPPALQGLMEGQPLLGGRAQAPGGIPVLCKDARCHQAAFLPGEQEVRLPRAWPCCLLIHESSCKAEDRRNNRGQETHSELSRAPGECSHWDSQLERPARAHRSSLWHSWGVPKFRL